MSIQLDHKTLGGTPLNGQGNMSVAPQPPQRPPSMTAKVAGMLLLAFQTSAIVGIVGAVGLLAIERIAPDDLKPSTLVGAYGGNIQSAAILTEIDAKRAEVGMQAEEQARAQQEVIALQAANERVNQAYAALYQRGVVLATAWANASTQALIIDFNTRAATLQTGVGEASNAKVMAGLGCDIAKLFLATPDCGDALRHSAREDRNSISDELMENYRKQSIAIAASLQDWNQGLPDPASMMAATMTAKDQILHAAPRRPVPASPVYDRKQAGVGQVARFGESQ